jgi:transcriptional regulator with XRE-family HTH domain
VFEARPPSVASASQGALPTPSAGAGDGKALADSADALATEVARAVRELRANAGLSERAAARILGTSQTQLRRMEDPRYLPSLRSLARVAAAYGHRLKIAFEPRERQPAKPARPAPRPRPVARQRRATTTRPSRGQPRPRRRA